jgi:hypothetical protein
MQKTAEVGLKAATSASCTVGNDRSAYHCLDKIQPRADAAAAESGVGAMKLETENHSSLLTKRRGSLLFISEPHTKPQHIKDKTGACTK